MSNNSNNVPKIKIPVVLYCPNCGGNTIEEDHNYCSMCRLDLSPYKYKCPGCGLERIHMNNIRLLNFCGACGFDYRNRIEFIHPVHHSGLPGLS